MKTVARKPGKNSDKTGFSRTIGALKLNQLTGQYTERQILKQLPHRYPILLVDRVLSIETGKRIVALKNVTINEPFFSGHFPHRPVMPGVLILEAMAQAACFSTSEFTEGRAAFREKRAPDFRG